MSEPVALLDALIYTQPEVSRPLSGGRHLDDVAVGGGHGIVHKSPIAKLRPSLC